MHLMGQTARNEDNAPEGRRRAAQKILISCFCRRVHVAVDGAVRRQEAARHLNILRPFIGSDRVTDDVAPPETDEETVASRKWTTAADGMSRTSIFGHLFGPC